MPLAPRPLALRSRTVHIVSVRKLTLPTALAATLFLTSCGSGGATPPAKGASTASATPTAAPHSVTATGIQSPVGPPAAGPSKITDVNFAISMVASHLQANLMADLAAKRAKDSRVKTLAPKLKAAQGPEVTTMAGWLVGGGILVPDANGGVDMAAMPGMAASKKAHMVISGTELDALGKATGPGFDRMWLTLMIKHHRGAVATAMNELVKGVNPGAKKIAQSIIDRQSAEITAMSAILAGTARG